MKIFTDEEMGALLPTARPYSVVILKRGPSSPTSRHWASSGSTAGAISALRDAGVLAVVLPVSDESDVCGIGVFAATVEDTTAIMADDPGVRAGVFTYEVHACRGFPGDALP